MFWSAVSIAAINPGTKETSGSQQGSTCSTHCVEAGARWVLYFSNTSWKV